MVYLFKMMIFHGELLVITRGKLETLGKWRLCPWGYHGSGVMWKPHLQRSSIKNRCLVVEPPTPLKNDGVRQLGWRHSQDIYTYIYIYRKLIDVPNHQPNYYTTMFVFFKSPISPQKIPHSHHDEKNKSHWLRPPESPATGYLGLNPSSTLQ